MPEEGRRPFVRLLVATALRDESVTFCRGAGTEFLPLSLSEFSSFYASRPKSLGKKVPVIYCGPGLGGLAKLEGIFSGGGVGKVLFCGFAGGLSPSIKTGDIVVARSILQPGRSQYLLTPPEFLSSRFRIGTFVSTEAIISSPAEKANLHAETGGDLVEMESAGWLVLAKKHNITSWFVRVISDTANESLPPELMHFVNEEGTTSIWGTFKTLLGRPSLVKELLSLSKGMILAHRRLRELGMVVATHPELLENSEESSR